MNKKTLSTWTYIFYGLGVSYAIVDQIFAQWVLYYYLPPQSSGLKPLIAPMFITIALIISRFVDAIFDPLVGHWSDNCTSKWGKRIPFIALGAVPLVFTTIAFFYPPGGNLIPLHLTVVGCLFFIFYTIVGAPYNALIPDIANNYEDRLNLSTFQSIFRLIYSAVAMILPGILIQTLGKGNTEMGIRKMVIVLSLFSLIGMMITVFTVKEKKTTDINSKTKDHFFKSVREIMKDKGFIFYLFGLLFFFVGFNILRTSMNYYVEDIMGLGKTHITIASATLFAFSAIFFYPVNKLSRKFGYRKIMLVSLVCLTVFSLALFSLGKFIPTKFGFAIFALVGCAISGAAFIFPPAMLSEIVVSRKKLHKNKEGLYFGIQGFFLKLAFLISIGILPIILVMGKDVSLMQALVNKPTGVSLQGVYGTSIASAVSFFISFIFYFFYSEDIIDDKE